MKDKGIEQKAFGAIIGMNQSNISGYVTGRISPTLKSMQLIVDALGYDLIAFLQIGRGGPKTPALAIEEPMKFEPPDKSVYDNIQGLLATQLQGHADIKELLRMQLESSVTTRAAITAAIENVRSVEHEKALAERDAYIHKLQAEIDRLQTKVEVKLLRLVPDDDRAA